MTVKGTAPPASYLTAPFIGTGITIAQQFQTLGNFVNQAGKKGYSGFVNAFLNNKPAGLGEMALGIISFLPDGFAEGEIVKIGAGLKPMAEGPELQAVINELYRDKDLVPGGTAGAVRYERATGNLLFPSGHIPKAQQRIAQLTRLLSSGKLSPNDAAIARALIDYLRGAIK